ncbi:MAG: SPOR domain-containing protein [Chitinophagaceae bacterium]
MNYFKIIVVFIVAFFSVLKSYSQDEVYIDTVLERNVVVFKDTRLDLLDNRPESLEKMATVDKTKSSKINAATEIPVYKPIVSKDGKKKITGSIYSAKGFRIIIYNGSDKAQALAAKNKFSRAFPSTPSYLSYNVPSYKIKVGNFESRNDANGFLKKIRAAFPASFIVPDIVTIKNINVIK